MHLWVTADIGREGDVSENLDSEAIINNATGFFGVLSRKLQQWIMNYAVPDKKGV